MSAASAIASLAASRMLGLWVRPKMDHSVLSKLSEPMRVSMIRKPSYSFSRVSFVASM
jgi:hypothetical protein